MPDWRQIKRELFLGSGTAYSKAQAFEGLETLRHYFGENWLTNQLGNQRGVAVVVPFIWLGLVLRRIQSVSGLENVINKIKKEGLSSPDVLDAWFLSYYSSQGLEVVYHPQVLVKNKIRHPDMKVIYAGSTIYLEASKFPLVEVWQQMGQLCQDIVSRINGRDIVVKLQSEPTNIISRQVVDACVCDAESVNDRAEYNIPSVADIQLHPYDVERSYDPGIGIKVFCCSGIGSSRSRCWMCYPWADKRALGKLQREGAQLPKNEPSVLVFDLTQLPTAMDYWPYLIGERFRLNYHRHVGAVIFLERILSNRHIISVKQIVVEHPNPEVKVPAGFLEFTSGISEFP